MILGVKVRFIMKLYLYVGQSLYHAITLFSLLCNYAGFMIRSERKGIWVWEQRQQTGSKLAIVSTNDRPYPICDTMPLRCRSACINFSDHAVPVRKLG